MWNVSVKNVRKHNFLRARKPVLTIKSVHRPIDWAVPWILLYLICIRVTSYTENNYSLRSQEHFTRRYKFRGTVLLIFYRILQSPHSKKINWSVHDTSLLLIQVNYCLTPRCRSFLEKLTDSQLAKNFPLYW